MKTWKENDGKWYGSNKIGSTYYFSATGENSRGETELELMVMEGRD